jgi:GNAT superfamily N-acetyltransferase
MTIDVSLVPLKEILALRDLYRQEMNCQIVHDSLHERGFTESYLIRVNGQVAGYGAVVRDRAGWKDVVKEFYVLPVHRAAALLLFRHFAAAGQARGVEAQTNDRLLTLMLFDCATSIKSETILFHDALTTSLSVPGITFRRVTEADKGRISPQTVEPIGDWMIEADREVAATGGILFHYNVPYGDIYMEVAEPFRRRGYGSYLVQELKRTCYEMGRIPAARCQASNEASRATLQKAGLLPCARILSGVIAA